jgi:hypothetical protein
MKTVLKLIVMAALFSAPVCYAQNLGIDSVKLVGAARVPADDTAFYGWGYFWVSNHLLSAQIGFADDQFVNDFIASGRIHGPANACSTGAVILTFQGLHENCLPCTLTYRGDVMLTDAQLAAYWAGHLYAEVTMFSGHAVRAQIVPSVALSPAVIPRPGYLRLRWPSLVGKSYQIQAAETLGSCGWTNLPLIIPATGTNTAVDLPLDQPQRFFRVLRVD